MPGPFLFVVAYPRELQAIPRVMKDASGVATATLGVGLAAAAAGTAELVRDVSPRAVLLVGTAGVYPGTRVKVGDACVVSTSRLADAGVAMRLSTIPPRVRSRIVPSPRLTRVLRSARARPVHAATSFGVTVDDGLAGKLKRHARADIENMEVHGVAVACVRAGVPFAALLGVANVVGGGGREAWRRGEARALAAVQRVLMRARATLLR